MRDEEAGMRYYQSHAVKQDLAKLDNKDVETRNIALSSLKQVVEQLDATSMSRFLTQIAESRETGAAARSYAISLYEDVARVHGKQVIPHLPLVMNALARSLLASGSSPQMHQQTCAKVTAALSRYTIDSTTSPEDAEQILRELSQPLANLIAGKLEPVAGGAAACLQALVETENWKQASSDSVHEICQRTTTALNEKSTRTVAHMHLIRSLASMNADILSIYGASLLRAGVDILTTSSNPWQQRMSAAKLLQDVLTILDKETLNSDLAFAMQGLESCRLDKTPHVRSAVSEALNTARLLASGDESKTSAGTAAATSPGSKTPERGRSLRRLGSHHHHPVSPPVSKRVASPGYQESRPPLPFSPVSSATGSPHHVVTQGSVANASPGRGARRAPLFPARDQVHQSHSSSSSPVSPSSSTTDEGDSEALALDAKENVPSRRSRVNQVDSPQYDLGLPGHHGLAARRKNWRSHLPPTPGVSSRSQPSSPLSRSMSKPQESRSEASQPVNSASRPVNSRKPAGLLPVADSTRDCPLPEDAFMMMNMGPMDVDFSTTHRADEHTGGEQRQQQHSNSTGLSFGNEVEVSLPRLRVGTAAIESSESAVQSKYVISCNDTDCKTPKPQFPQIQACLDTSINKEKKSCFPTSRSSDNSNEGVGNDVFGREGDVVKVAETEAASAEKPEILLTPKDQLPLTTQRPTRALQPGFESPDSYVTASTPDPDVKPCGNDDVLLGGESSLLKQAGVEMDVETSSDAGWSMRENPLASDESFRSGESSEEDLDKNIYRTSVILHRKAWSVDGGLLHEGAQNRGLHFGNGDDIGTWRMTPKPIRSVRSFSGVSVSDELCSATTGAEPKKLFLAAEPPTAEAGALEDEDRNGANSSSSGIEDGLTMTMTTQQCCGCNKIVIQAPATKSSTDGDGTRDEKLPESSPEEKAKGWWDRRLGHHPFMSWFLKKNWAKVRWYGEILLVGSLCVVVALPVAILVAKTLTTSRDLPLVPT